MRGYLSVVSARFRSLLQYRAAAIAGLVTQLFWGLIRVMIFTAFYRASDTSQPMDIDSVVGYVWLGQAFILLQPWGVDRDVRDQIRSGSVAYELLKPLDLYTLWFCRAIAMKTAPTLLRSLPLLTIAGLFFGLQPPASLEALAAFSVALTAAVLLSAAITVILNVSLLWTISGDGVSTLVPAFGFIFSGMIVPLPLFPDWAQPILNALPFRYFADVPFRLYLGHMAPSDLFDILLLLAAWTVCVVLLGRALLAIARRRLIVQGG